MEMKASFRLAGIEELIHDFSFDGAIERIARTAMGADSILSKEYILENVIPCLVNTEENSALLTDKETLEFLDLSIIFRVITLEREEGIGNYILTKSIVKMNGITEDELFKRAEENASRMMPLQLSVLLNNGKDIMKLDSVDDISDEPHLLVLSNEKRVHGAIAILDEDVMRQIADKYQKDLVIYPSSIHECLVCPVMKDMTMDGLNGLVIWVNETKVSSEERLANHVYLYVRETGEIIVPDNESLLRSVAN